MLLYTTDETERVVLSSVLHDGTSWESVPCRSGSLHPGYCLSSLLKWSHLAIMLIARHNMTHQKFHLNNFTKY